jgi:hypothetical protein
MKCLLLLLAAVVACGPSSAQLKAAKTAQYKASAQTVYDIALAVAQEDYQVTEADAANGRFITRPQFYSKEGGRQSAGAGDFVQTTPGSVRLQLFVEVVGVGDGKVAVTVTPRTLQIVGGSPKPRELEPDDPDLPPWVLGRVDSLQLAIHERATPYLASP